MMRAANALRQASATDEPPRDLADLERDDRIALFLDIDGTLVDLAPTPSDVKVSDALRTSLARLDDRLSGALALVSGRTIADIDRLFAPLALRASGVHGAERRLDPLNRVEEALQADPLPLALWGELNGVMGGYPLLLIENKQYSFCVHYRLCPELYDELRDRLAAMLQSPEWRGVNLEEAHYAFELKPPSFNKGDAIRDFMTRPPFAGRTPVFVGDDKTDESGFAVVSALGGFAYSVALLRTGASAFFETPADVRNWLANLAGSDRQ